MKRACRAGDEGRRERTTQKGLSPLRPRPRCCRFARHALHALGGFIGKSEENSALGRGQRLARAPSARAPVQQTRTEREREVGAFPRGARLARHLAVPQQQVCGAVRHHPRARSEAERVVLLRVQRSGARRSNASGARRFVWRKAQPAAVPRARTLRHARRSSARRPAAMPAIWRARRVCFVRKPPVRGAFAGRGRRRQRCGGVVDAQGRERNWPAQQPELTLNSES